jgi:retinol dehydrogenase-14
MSDKIYAEAPICVITGATGGIGKAVVNELFCHNAKIIVVARNPDKYRILIEDIKDNHLKCTYHKHLKEMSNYSEGPSIGFFEADLSLLSEVKRISQEICDCFDRIDILINNVGGYFARRTITEEGFELTFALNYLGPLLMTYLLIPSLSRSENGQVLNISSSAHKMGKINLDDLQLKVHYVGLKAYSQSKRAMLLLTQELSKELKPKNIKINSIHPGVVKTNIAQTHRGLQALIFTFLKHTVAISPKKAAKRILDVLLTKKFKNISGAYISKTKIKRNYIISSDKKFRNTLEGITWKYLFPNLSIPYRIGSSDSPYCLHELEKFL